MKLSLRNGGNGNKGVFDKQLHVGFSEFSVWRNIGPRSSKTRLRNHLVGWGTLGGDIGGKEVPGKVSKQGVKIVAEGGVGFCKDKFKLGRRPLPCCTKESAGGSQNHVGWC